MQSGVFLGLYSLVAFHLRTIGLKFSVMNMPQKFAFETAINEFKNITAVLKSS